MPNNQSLDRVREEIAHMFASAWQDGVHHLNPKYLRRDTLFTDKVLEILNSELQNLRSELAREIKIHKKVTSGFIHDDYLRGEYTGFNQATDKVLAIIKGEK